MKALQCIELGGPEKLIVSEIPDPIIAEEHVIIEVRSASVNFPDVLMIQGLYQFNPLFLLHREVNQLELLQRLGKELKILKSEIKYLLQLELAEYQKRY
jgi:NADPH:quinone reductase-like Zn-dependent oxidoreductase